MSPRLFAKPPLSHPTKKFCMYWKGSIYAQHIAIQGLATAGGIQENIVDTALDLLKFHEIKPAVKWVKDFVFFRCPLMCLSPPSSPSFSFDLSSIL